MTATLAPSAAVAEPAARPFDATMAGLARYALIGVALGVVLVKSQVIYWVRIHEMFRFESFHMYGMFGSAVATAFLSLRLLMWREARARNGERIALAPKTMEKGHRYWIGGALFGTGWALCGACPGPLFALIGGGTTVYVVTAIFALAGTWTYGVLRPHLPH